jgi:hypothetical protein
MFALLALTLVPRAQALELHHAPLKVGRPAVLVATGATPGATVWFLQSTAGEGAGPCSPLGGQCLGILSPTVSGSAVANALGIAVLRRPLPAAAPLVDASLQAVEIGANPQLSPPVTSPLLGEHVGDVVLGSTITEDELRHLWRLDGQLYLGAGAHALYLPDLEELGRIETNNTATDVTLELPALRTLGSASFFASGEVTLDLPALETWTDDPVAPEYEGLYVGLADSFTLRADQVTHISSIRIYDASVVLELPALRTLGHLTLASNTGGVVLDLPALESVEAPVPTRLNSQPDLNLLNVQDVYDLDIFPSLTLVEGAINVNCPDLISLTRLGADGLVGQTSGGYWGLTVNSNPALTSVSAFVGASFGGTVQVSSNGLLPSCEAEALINRVSGSTISCYRNLADACVYPGSTCR